MARFYFASFAAKIMSFSKFSDKWQMTFCTRKSKMSSSKDGELCLVHVIFGGNFVFFQTEIRSKRIQFTFEPMGHACLIFFAQSILLKQ